MLWIKASPAKQLRTHSIPVAKSISSERAARKLMQQRLIDDRDCTADVAIATNRIGAGDLIREHRECF